MKSDMPLKKKKTTSQTKQLFTHTLNDIILSLCKDLGPNYGFNRFGWVGFYGISILVGYLTPNPFLYIETVLFQTIQFNISTQFKCQKSSISNNSF